MERDQSFNTDFIGFGGVCVWQSDAVRRRIKYTGWLLVGDNQLGYFRRIGLASCSLNSDRRSAAFGRQS